MFICLLLDFSLLWLNDSAKSREACWSELMKVYFKSRIRLGESEKVIVNVRIYQETNCKEFNF